MLYRAKDFSANIEKVVGDPAIELLGIYPKVTNAMKCWNTCTLMFIAAMSTIAKLWKEPRCPSKDK